MLQHQETQRTTASARAHKILMHELLPTSENRSEFVVLCLKSSPSGVSLKLVFAG